MDAVDPTLLPSEPLKAAVRYYKNHGDALFRFVDDPIVPIDNSPIEREFQNVAKLRLNMLFAGSTEGAHRACVFLGIVATCRAQGVPAQPYLTAPLARRRRSRYAAASTASPGDRRRVNASLAASAGAALARDRSRSSSGCATR